MHFSVYYDKTKKNKQQKDMRFIKNQKMPKLLNVCDKQNFHYTQYIDEQYTFKKKQMKINHNTVNITLNQIKLNNSQLLDSLLFSNQKQQKQCQSQFSDDQLLLSDYKQEHVIDLQQYYNTFKHPTVVKNPQKQFQYLIICPKIQNMKKDYGVLWKRLKYTFNHKNNLIDFYLSISQSTNQLSFITNIRSFLFSNNIIFNKHQLSQFLEIFQCNQYIPDKIGCNIQKLFLQNICQNQTQIIISDHRIRYQLGYVHHNLWDFLHMLRSQQRQIKILREWINSKLLP